MLRIKNIKKGFTVAEVVVAAAIFVVFSGAVFSIYRMGSRMYVSGSWKFIRQKEAERFFEVLKERIEQSSDIIKVNPKGDPKSTNEANKQIVKSEASFVTLKNNSCISLSGAQRANKNVQLAEFVTCKPDLTLIDNTKKGLALFHSLMLVANKETGLYDLHLRVQKNNNAADGVSYFGGLGKSCLENGFGSVNMANFNGANVENFYGLGPVPHTFILRDVASVTIGVAKSETIGSGDNKTEPSIFGITVQMRNPKHDKTTLQMGYKAKVDGSVGLEAR